MNLTRRERLIRCYYHQDLDRPAVCCPSDFPVEDASYDRLKQYIQEKTVQKKSWPAAQYCTNMPGFSAHEAKHSDEFNRRVDFLKTPAGKLRHSFFVGLNGQPRQMEEYLIKSAEDAEMYLSLPPLEFTGESLSFFEANMFLGDAGVLDVELGYSPSAHVAALCGPENFTSLAASNRDVLYALCERRMKELLELMKFFNKEEVGPCLSMIEAEELVPLLHEPEGFQDFVARFDQPVIDLIHEGDSRINVKAHVLNKEILQCFVDLGVDVLHPLEALQTDDFWLKDVKSIIRGKTCLEGNILIDRMYDASAKDIKEETRQLVKAIFKDRKGLIISPTESPRRPGKGDVCFPQYKAMINTILARG